MSTAAEIEQAFLFYSGRNYGLNRPNVDLIAGQMEEHGLSAWEYFWFADRYLRSVEMLSLAHVGGGIAKNSKFLRELSEWAPGRKRQTKVTTEVQLFRIGSLLQAGVPLTTILSDPRESLSAVVRIDSALQYLEDPNPVLKKHGPEALLMLAGSPEYAELCPRAYAWFMKEKEAVLCRR